MATAAIIRCGIPQHDQTEFVSLQEHQRWEVLDLLDIFQNASRTPSWRNDLKAVAAANAGRRGWSFKSLERKYYALRETRDWHSLINKTKLCGGSKTKLTKKVLEYWHTLYDKSMRSGYSSWVRLCNQYRNGEMIGDENWRTEWQRNSRLCHDPMPNKCPAGMTLPEAWSYHNMMRYKPKQVEIIAARKGRHAAKKYVSQVHTTRANLPVGAQYEFDDMWHNVEVVVPGQHKPVRPLELACIDISSAHKVAFGLKPRKINPVTGKRENLREEDMRFIVAHVLCNIGYHPDGCILFVEGGTATLCGRLQKLLSELSGGLITVSMSGVDRKVLLGKWGHDTKGNPDHKSHIESSHNLYQNRMDHLPGYTGSNSRLDKPEDHEALMRVVDKMMAAQFQLPPDLASRLRFPILDWDTFSAVVHEIYEQIAWSNDHKLEGWDKRTEKQFKLHPAGIWRSESAYQALPRKMQLELDPLIASTNVTRKARLSRKQWFNRGKDKLIKLPDYAACLICGEDMAEPRNCPATGEIIFIDKEKDPAPMIFNISTCVDANEQPVQLLEGKQYLWMINPFDTRVAFVQDTFGCYIGKCTRIEAVDRADLEAIGHEIGRSRKDLEKALKPFNTRQVRKAVLQTAINDHNTQLLDEGTTRLLEEAQKKQKLSGDRAKRIAGKSVRNIVK